MFVQILILTILGYFCSGANAQCNPACGPYGVCKLVNNVATCECNSNYIGSYCQLLSPCSSNPCRPNGACFPRLVTLNGVEQATYHCQCYSGFTGLNCQKVAPKPCASNPCLNNGVCSNIPNTWSYRCDCVGPYTGHNCGEYVDYCLHNKCLNNALCVPDSQNKTYHCECLNGFYGQFCENEVNECLVAGPTGTNTSPCKNGGICYDLIDNFVCECVGSYTGALCETYVDPCSSNPCGAGASCVSNQNGYSCQCQNGFFGTSCYPNPCISNPCRQAGSTCVPVEPGVITGGSGCTCSNASPSYVCLCPNGIPEYASSRC